MKNKIINIFFIAIALFMLIGCDNKKVKINNKEINNMNLNNKSVVIYFSATGTTKKIASRIALLSNSDIIEIIPKEKYTNSDLDYNSDCRANREQNDSNARPEIQNIIDISKYDTIYLGYPIWWGTNPKIILTMLDTYDFSGKVIIPFCTSGSTDIIDSVNDLRNYNSNLYIKDGKRFSLSSSDSDILEFISSNKVTSKVKIIINSNEYAINLEDNEVVKDFVNLLPKEFNMNELNGNEKYVYLDQNLPASPINVKHIDAGDVMLYGSNCLVLFYKSFDTTYSYTKIGHIDNLPNLGSENVHIKIEK